MKNVRCETHVFLVRTIQKERSALEKQRNDTEAEEKDFGFMVIMTGFVIPGSRQNCYNANKDIFWTYEDISEEMTNCYNIFYKKNFKGEVYVRKKNKHLPGKGLDGYQWKPDPGAWRLRILRERNLLLVW